MNSIKARAIPFRATVFLAISMLGIFAFGTAMAAKTPNIYCGLQPPSVTEKRLCENETLFELDRKLSSLEEELGRGWGNYPYEESEAWRQKIRNACQNDSCLEFVYHRQLAKLKAFPSFLCKARLTRSEKLICQTPAMGELDRKLNLEYQHALDFSSRTLELIQLQHHWLFTVRNRCSSASCLMRVYKQRIRHFINLQQQAVLRRKRENAGSNLVDARGAGLRDLKFTKAQRKSIAKQIYADPDVGDFQNGDGSNCLAEPVDLVDLNHDGLPDPVFMTCGGAHNEQVFFFLNEHGRFRLVLSDYVGYFGYQLQDTKIRGFSVLRLITHTSCCKHPSAFFAYDGQAYQNVVTFDERFVNENLYFFD